MIEIARAIEGISINGKEFLLDEKGETMKFEDRKAAFDFLKSNGFEHFSDEKLEDSFFIEESN